jgi:hypothetical protein
MFDLNDYVEGSDVSEEIMNSEAVSTIIADTNTDDWTFDQFEVLSITTTRIGFDVVLHWYASGNQKEDHMYCGTRVEGNVTLACNDDGAYEVKEITAELKWD